MRLLVTGMLASIALAIPLNALAQQEEPVTAPNSPRMSPDAAAVESVARDYIEGWYTGDVERMSPLKTAYPRWCPLQER